MKTKQIFVPVFLVMSLAAMLIISTLTESSVLGYYDRTNSECQRIVDQEERELCLDYNRVRRETKACTDQHGQQDTPELIDCLGKIRQTKDGWSGGDAFCDSAEGKRAEYCKCTFESNPECYCSLAANIGDSRCIGIVGDKPPSYGASENPIYVRLNQIIQVLAVGAVMFISLLVIVAGIQWSASSGDPQKKAAAISKLWSAAIALLVFVLGYTLLNWLVPGGALG